MTGALAGSNRDLRSRTAVAPADYLAAALERADDALRASGTIGRAFRIAGRTLRFRFAGPALAHAMTRALTHLADDVPGRADLDISVFDTETSGVAMLPPPWRDGELRVHGEIESLIDAGLYAHFNVYHGSLIILDPSAGRGVYWMPDPTCFPDHETATPVISLFQGWLGPSGLALVHAAAVGTDRGGALLVGVNGAGKSNTVLSCLGSELGFVGDDRCLIGCDPDPVAYSLYSSAKIWGGDESEIPSMARLGDHCELMSTGKTVIFLNECAPGSLRAGTPITCILYPQVTDRRATAIRPAQRAPGVRMLASETALRWPATGRQTVGAISEVFRRAPVHTLELGTDRTRIAPVILDFLESGAGRTGA